MIRSRMCSTRATRWEVTRRMPGSSQGMGTALTIAAVVSFYIARSVRIDNESSKLLLLTPHNGSVSDLQDALGSPTPNYPPTLYDFYLACVYKKHLLKDNLACFPRSAANVKTRLPSTMRSNQSKSTSATILSAQTGKACAPQSRRARPEHSTYSNAAPAPPTPRVR